MGGVTAYLLPAMPQTRTIVAVDPATGARLTRRTARTYVAVVVTGDPEKGQAWPQSWAGRPDLAAKRLAKWGPGSTARLAPVVEDPWTEAVVAEPEAVARLGFATFNPETEALGEALPADCYPPARPEPALPGEVRPGAAAPDARPVLPGEAEPPAPVAQDGPAPVLPNLPRVAPASVARGCFAPVGTPPRDAATLARLRADAAAGRPVSLTALAGALAADPAAPGRLRTRAAGEPWDPGTPEARARVALQGERVATLWPIAQAVRGAGFDLPPVWWADGPILAGERTYGEALAALPLGAIAAAATALAALPPVTAAQDRALRLCRGEAVGV